jgi:adenylate cyclase
MQKTIYRQLPLAPLGPDAIRELLEDLLGADASMTGLAEIIHARTGGNPFFTEEVVQSLIESRHLEGTRGAYRLVTAIERLSIPNTVQSILAARIDKQAEREKYVLQAAAVIGKEFSETILSQVVDLPGDELAAALAALKSAEFVFEQSLYPAVEYAFKHPLTQEVALESQLAERRRGLHARVARAIESAEAERLEERAALLAHHWEEAGEAGEAMAWHRRAAEWVGASNPAESLRHWQRVRELGKRYDGDVDELRLLACLRVVTAGSWRSGFEETELSALVTEGRALAERLGRPVDAATMLSAVAMVRGTRGDIAGALVALDEILEIYHPTDAPEDADLDTALGYWNFAAGNLAFALERFDATVRRTAGDATMGLDSAGISHQCWAHTLAGQALSQMGRISEALDRLDGVADTARAIGAGENVVWAHGALIDTSRLAGGAQLLGGVDPRRLAAEGVQIAESVGSSYTRVLAELWLAAAFLLQQDWGAAEQHAQAGLARCLETQTAGENVPRFHGVLGEARRGQGDLEGAVVAMEEAARTGDSGGMVFFAAQARSELANLLVETRAPADVIFEVIRRGREQVAQTGGHSVGARLTEAEAGLAGREGDPVRREQGLCEAERAFREMGATGHAERVGRELEGLGAVIPDG